MRAILLMLFILISACTTAHSKNSNSNNNYDQTVQNWRGKSVSQLIARWGQPNQLIKTAKGHSFYAYTTESYKSYPQPPSPPYVMSVGKNNRAVITKMPTIPEGSEKLSLQCLAVFEVDSRGVIVGTQTDGNACIGIEP